jgi:putative nucleotidyltransferase with HDIG domain
VKIHPAIKDIAKVFSNGGKQVYLVGGAVRGPLMRKRPADLDLATDALPEEVTAMFLSSNPRGYIIPTGIKHGTVTVLFKGLKFEITTFRAESGYSDGRRPDKVEFGVSIEADLSRRDFTMNAIAWKLPSGPLVDPFKGAKDIKAKIIRCVGAAEERFAEDGLRPLRGLRFASQLEFKVDEAVLAAIPSSLGLTAKISPERVRDEIDKIIASKRPSISLRLMEQTGLLNLIIPELAACRKIEQKGRHRFDVLEHSLMACDFAAAEKYPHEIRLAALYHDIGKRSVAKLDADGNYSFHRHEKQSALDARNIMLRLRYPNVVTDEVCHLIEEHMFFYEENWTDAAVRRFIIKIGEKNLDSIYRLRRADTYGICGIPPPPDYLLPLQERVEKILAGQKAFSIKDLEISGNDLKEAGVRPGKEMGIILNELLETVIEDPELNTREKLLEIALKINARYTEAPA